MTIFGHSSFVINWSFSAIPWSLAPGHWTFFLAWLRRARDRPKNGRTTGLNPALLLLLFKSEMVDLSSAGGYFGAVTTL
jgi:hypothetical protein